MCRGAGKKEQESRAPGGEERSLGQRCMGDALGYTVTLVAAVQVPKPRHEGWGGPPLAPSYTVRDGGQPGVPKLWQAEQAVWRSWLS